MVKKLSAILICVLLSILNIGCNPTSITTDPPEPPAPETTEPWEDFENVESAGEVQFSHFPKMTKVKKVYVINYDFAGQQPYNNLAKFNDILTLSAFQGLAMKNNSSENIYLNVLSQAGHDSGFSEKWLNEIVVNDDVVAEVLTGEEILKQVSDKFSHCVAKAPSGKNGYVLYKQVLSDGTNVDGGNTKIGSQSVNASFTLASAYGYLPIDESMVALFDALGYEQVFDARNMTEEEAYTLCADKLSGEFISMTPNNDCENRDYGIAVGAPYLDEAYKSADFLKKLAEKYPKNNNAIVMGWGSSNEVNQIKQHGQNGFGFLCTVYNYNLTIFSSLGQKVFKQRNDDTVIQADEKKHYVSFIMSDGDNISWHQNSFTSANGFFGYSLDKKVRSENKFKMGWSIAPTMVDLLPAVMRYEYKKSSPYDYFVAGTSGSLTNYPTTFGRENDGTLDMLVRSTDEYMRRSDLQYTEILNDSKIGESNSELPFDDYVMEKYASMPNIHGAFVMANYNKYIQGGDLRWYNGKPFLGIADGYWSDTAGKVAHRINSLKPSVHSVNGYTAIKVHCWSTTMFDMANMVERLDEHIEIVSPGELMTLIENNVEKKNQTRTVKPNVDYPDNVDEYLNPKKIYENTPLNATTEFTFDKNDDYCGWNKYIGGKEYDYVSFAGDKWKHNPNGGGKQSADGGDGYSIRFDGSDYGLADETPNSAIYSKFFIVDSRYAKLSMQIKSAYPPHKAKYRVRVITKENDIYTVNLLKTGREIKDSTYTFAEGEWREVTYALPQFRGKEVVILIEYSPDVGECYVDDIKLLF